MRTNTLRPVGIVTFVVACLVVGGWQVYKWRHPSPSTQQTSQTPNIGACDSVQRDMRYTTVRTVVNPYGTCAPNFWHPGHRIWVWQAGKSADTDKILVCDPKLPDPQYQCRPMPVDVEAVASADTEFVAFIQLMPRNVTQIFR